MKAKILQCKRSQTIKNKTQKVCLQVFQYSLAERSAILMYTPVFTKLFECWNIQGQNYWIICDCVAGAEMGD